MFESRPEVRRPSRRRDPTHALPKHLDAFARHVEAPTLCRVGILDQVGRRRRAIPGQCEIELCHLERRLRVGALPDGQTQNLPLQRFVTEGTLPEIPPLRKDASAFLRQVNAALLGEADPDAVLEHWIQSYPLAELVEIHVAGVGDGSRQIQIPVTLGEPAPAVKTSPYDAPGARLGHFLSGTHHTPFECDRRSSQLPRRAGRIESHHRSIEQGLLRIRLEYVPFLRAQPAYERVRIKRGSRVQGEHPAVRRVQGDHSPIERVGEDLVNPFHQVEIQREPNIFAGLTGVFLDARERPHDATQRIDLEISHSSAPLESLFILALDAHLADQEALLVLQKARLAEFFSRDLVDVAQYVRHGTPRNVAPLRPHLDDDTGKVFASLLEDGDRIEIRIDLDDQRLPSLVLPHQNLDPFVRKPEMGPESF